jgi:hypothetical protein
MPNKHLELMLRLQLPPDSAISQACLRKPTNGDFILPFGKIISLMTLIAAHLLVLLSRYVQIWTISNLSSMVNTVVQLLTSFLDSCGILLTDRSASSLLLYSVYSQLRNSNNNILKQKPE